MSLEAIKQVAETEETYQRQRDEAIAAAKKMVADAEREGKSHLERTRALAETETRSFLTDAENKAAIQAEQVMKDARQRCAEICKTAEERLEKAVSLIVERVVNA